MNSYCSSEDVARALRRRIIILIITSTMVVALTFGISFYFALVSNETAVATKMPELESLVGNLKRILLINTFAFAAVIIASLYALSSLITARMFRPIESMMRDLRALGTGALPVHREPVRDEPFTGFDEMFNTVLSALQSREQKESEEIRQCLSILTAEADVEKIKCKLNGILQEKENFLGSGGVGGNEERPEDEHDPLFMQPV